MIARAFQLRNSLVSRLKYPFAESTWQQFPRPFNVPTTKKEKKLLYNRKTGPFPKYVTNLNDTLYMPGLQGGQMLSLYEDFISTKDAPLSSQYVALLLYNFAKEGLINSVSWPKLETYITRNRGQFSLRSVFGSLYACIKYGKLEYIEFFVEEMKGQTLSFTDMEAVQIIEAFNLSKFPYEEEMKFNFWDTYFKPHYVAVVTPEVRVHKFSNAIRIFDAFDKFGYYHDEEIWNNIISWLERRKGWKRTEVIQRLYPLTGTFQKAKELFDIYYNELSHSPHVQWRYNLEEMRFYSSEEMIAKSQENIEMKPSDRTLFDRKDQKKLNQEYQEWLQDGARQKQAELVKDKAQSLAYAIKNRYDSMKKDNVDFSKLTTQEFQDLFGSYEKDMMYNYQEDEDAKKSKQEMQEEINKEIEKNEKKNK